MVNYTTTLKRHAMMNISKKTLHLREPVLCVTLSLEREIALVIESSWYYNSHHITGGMHNG